MGMGATLSILGLYQWDNALFNTMYVPEGFTTDDRQTLVNNILMECAELELIYPDWDFMQWAIENWSHKEKPTWDRIYSAAQLEYNPIENYNRNEVTTITDDGSDQHSGNDVSRNSGSDTTASTGSSTNTHDVTGYESGTYVPKDKMTNSSSDSVTATYGGTNTFTHGEKIDRDNERTIEGNISGNIGVTTSQQMLEQEIAIAPKLNIMNMIIRDFKIRFCLLVY